MASKPNKTQPTAAPVETFLAAVTPDVRRMTPRRSVR